MKAFKTIISVILAASLIMCSFCACTVTLSSNDIVILFTGNANTDSNTAEGFSAVSAYRRSMNANHNLVALVDCGNSAFGSAKKLIIGEEYSIKLMNEAGYDICAIGDRDVSHLNAESAETLSAPLLSVSLAENENVIDILPYAVEHFASKTVAFIGVTGSADETGLAGLINSVAAEANADYTVVLSTIDEIFAEKLIVQLESVDAVLASGGKITAQKLLTDKDGKAVIYSNCGSGLEAIGQLLITPTGTLAASAVYSSEKDEDIAAVATEFEKQYEEKMNEEIAALSYSISGENSSGIVMNENRETPIGDFAADAYAKAAQTSIAFIPGGTFSGSLNAGTVTLRDLLGVVKHGDEILTAEISGETLADMLEFAAAKTAGYYAVGGAANGTSPAFLQLSGVSFRINTNIPTPVITDNNGTFVSIGSGSRRVSRIKVQNENDEFVDLEEGSTYKFAAPASLFSDSFGFAMLNGVETADTGSLDYEVLREYLQSFSADYSSAKGLITVY